MFDLDVVNAFSVGTVVVLKNYCLTNVKKGQVKLHKNSSSVKGLTVFVGITGDLTGKLIFNLKKETAFKLVSSLNREPINKTNDIFVATMKEFTNLVAGAAINELSKKHIDLDMTPPSIIISDEMSMIKEGSNQVLSVSYETDIGSIMLSLIFDD